MHFILLLFAADLDGDSNTTVDWLAAWWRTRLYQLGLQHRINDLVCAVLFRCLWQVLRITIPYLNSNKY